MQLKNNQEAPCLPVQLRCAFRPLESLAEPRANFSAGGKSSVVTREVFLQQSSLPEAVTRFLAEMDRKLDMLIAQLGQGQVHTLFPLTGQCVALSASQGMFQCRHALAPGDMLECLIFVQEIPSEFLTLSGVVQGIASTVSEKYLVESDSADFFEPAKGSLYQIHFAQLFEEEQDGLIRFLRQQERKLIRRRKLEEE